MSVPIATNTTPTVTEPEPGRTARFHGADGSPVVGLVTEVDARHRLARLETQNGETVTLPYELLEATWEISR